MRTNRFYISIGCRQKIKSSLSSLYHVEARNEWGAYLHGLVPGQHSSERTLRLRRAVYLTVSNLTVREIEPQVYRTDVLNNWANGRWSLHNTSFCFGLFMEIDDFAEKK